GAGRFPVKTTMVAGSGGRDQVDYTAYDPVKGVVLQKTGPNGIHSCFTYDDLARQTSETARCGSDSPIVTTTGDFLLPGDCDPDSCPPPGPGIVFRPTNAKLVTVTRPPTGSATWSYTDDHGKAVAALARSFGGGFTETLSRYNALGQVAQVSKPFLLASLTDAP